MRFLVLAPIKTDTTASRCHLLVVKFHKPVFKFNMHVANTTRLLLIPHARCKFHALAFLLCAPVVNATRPFLVPHALFWKHFLCIQMTETKIPCFEGNIPCFRAKFLVVRGKIPCSRMWFKIFMKRQLSWPLKQLFRPKINCFTPKNFLCWAYWGSLRYQIMQKCY